MTALTRLLAEIVLRPPDLRHFDAGLSQLATHPRGEVELKRSVELLYTTRCPTCGRRLWSRSTSGRPERRRRRERCSTAPSVVSRPVPTSHASRRSTTTICEHSPRSATSRPGDPRVVGLHLVPAWQGDIPVRGRMDGNADGRSAAARPTHPVERDGRSLPGHTARTGRAGALQAGRPARRSCGGRWKSRTGISSSRIICAAWRLAKRPIWPSWPPRRPSIRR